MVILTIFIIIYSVVQAYINTLYLNSFLNSNFKNNKKILLVSAIVLVDSILSISQHVIMSVLLFTVLLFIFCQYIYTNKVSKKLFHTLTLAFVTIASDTIIFTIMLNDNNLHTLYSMNHITLFIAGILSSLLTLIIIIFYKRVNRNNILELMAREYLLMAVIPLISIIAIYNIYVSYDNVYEIVISYILLLIANITIMAIHFSIMNRNEKMNQHMFTQLENEYYKSMLDDQEDKNEIIHDFKNILTTFDYALKKGETVLVANQIESLLGSEIYNNSLSGCIPIDAILNRQIQKMKKLDLDYELDILLPKDLQIDKLNNLAVIIGNLLDNAIEGVQRVSDVEERKIVINIKYHDNKIVVKIENTCNNLNIDFENLNIISQKSNGRNGIGIRSIKHNVKKMNGYVDFSIENNVFKVLVVVSTL